MTPSSKTIVNRLFKTTDGVTMYLDMEIWYIYGDRDKIDKLEIKSTKVKAIGNKSWSDADGGGNGLPIFARPGNEIFSTHQKAVEWVINNLEKVISKFKKQQKKNSSQKKISPDQIVASFKKTEDGIPMYPGLKVFVVYKCNPLTIREFNLDKVSSDGYNAEAFYFADINNAKIRQKALVENYLIK